MSNKTPEQVAEAIELPRVISSGDTIRRLIVEGIEAYRKQTFYLLVSEHDDTGVIAMYYTEQDAIDAAILNCPDDPDSWDDYYSVMEV